VDAAEDAGEPCLLAQIEESHSLLRVECADQLAMALAMIAAFDT
jgi:hypothetical protein